VFGASGGSMRMGAGAGSTVLPSGLVSRSLMTSEATGPGGQ
jgi:hypothetical protein